MFSRQYNCGTLQEQHQSALKSCVHVNAMLRDKEALNFTPRTPYTIHIFIAMQQISCMTVVAAFRSSIATHFPIREATCLLYINRNTDNMWRKTPLSVRQAAAGKKNLHFYVSRCTCNLKVSMMTGSHKKNWGKLSWYGGLKSSPLPTPPAKKCVICCEKSSNDGITYTTHNPRMQSQSGISVSWNKDTNLILLSRPQVSVSRINSGRSWSLCPYILHFKFRH